jgi:hypothetical protein
MANLNVQIGHVNGQGGAPYEEETLRLIVPHLETRLRTAGHRVNHFDGSLQSQPANYQHGGDGTIFCHCDSNGSGNSYSIGYWEEEHPGSQALALVLRDTYKQLGIPWNNFNITAGEWHYYGNRRFAHSCKCCLIEFGFVSNPKQRVFLQQNAQRVGYVTADAYIKFFGGVVPPQPVEEDDMFAEVVPFVECAKDGDLFVYVAAEGWWDLPSMRGNCYLIMKNETATDANGVKIMTTPFAKAGVKTINVPQKDNPASRQVVDMVSFAPAGGFSTTVKSPVPLVCQLSVIAKEK